MSVQAWFDGAKARRRPKRTAVLRPVGASRACELAILGIERRILRAMREKVRNEVLPAAKLGKEELKSVYGFGIVFETFREFLRGFVHGFNFRVRDAFRTEDARHSARSREAARSAIGVDLARAIQHEGIEPAIEAATLRTVGLIRGLADETARKIEQTLIAAMTAGEANKTIASKLTALFGIADRRAQLIARDQAASFNGNLNRIRQEEAGVTEYIWSTSLDERVRGNPDGKYPNARPSHWAREGKRFRWDKPPSDGHPGEAINCRCIAKAVIEF